jgi:hypothetical protein
MIKLSDAINLNKTLVRLDLSNNALKSPTMRFFLEAMLDNSTLADLRLAGNFLDNEFAVDLAHLLEVN